MLVKSGGVIAWDKGWEIIRGNRMRLKTLAKSPFLRVHKENEQSHTQKKQRNEIPRQKCWN